MILPKAICIQVSKMKDKKDSSNNQHQTRNQKGHEFSEELSDIAI